MHQYSQIGPYQENESSLPRETASTSENGPSYDYITFDISNIYVWDRSGKNSPFFELTTKDLDFGSPAQDKQIYKVYITYAMKVPSGGSFPKVRVVGIVTTDDGIYNLYPHVSRGSSEEDHLDPVELDRMSICENYGRVRDREIQFDHALNNDDESIGYLESLYPTNREVLEDPQDQDFVHDDLAVHQKLSRVATIVFDDKQKRLSRAKSFKIKLMCSGQNHSPGDPVVHNPGTFVKTHKDFELSDISIVYRIKGVK